MGLTIGNALGIPWGGKGGGLGYTQDDWYGVEINEANSSPDVTRIAGTNKMSLHASLPIHNMLKGCLLSDDGSVNYYLKPDDWSKKTDGTASNLDGTDGMVMMEWPNFYFKVDMDANGAGKHHIKISQFPITGYTLVPKHYVSAYEAALNRSTNKLSSVKNTTTTYRGGINNAAWDAAANTLLGKPATNINRTSFRTYARNRGAGWNQYGYDDHKWLFWLFAIEYATLNAQKTINASLTSQGYKQGGLGYGVSSANSTEWNNFNGYNPFIPCGASDNIGNGSGAVDSVVTNFGGAGINRTFSVNRYRGHEMPFGHIWKILDGVNVNIQAVDAGGLSQVFVAAEPSNWNDSNYNNYTNRGNINRTEGYMSKALLGVGAEFVAREAGISGSGSNTFYCDYFYTSIPPSGTSLRMLLVSGYAYYGAYGGLAYSSSLYGPSFAHATLGSRLCYIP